VQAWNNTNTTQADVIGGPLSAAKAIIPTATAAGHYITVNLSATGAESCAFIAAAGANDWVFWSFLYDSTWHPFYVNLSTGAVGATPDAAFATITTEDLGGGYWLVRADFASALTKSGQIIFGLAASDGSADVSAGDGSTPGAYLAYSNVYAHAAAEWTRPILTTTAARTTGAEVRPEFDDAANYPGGEGRMTVEGYWRDLGATFTGSAIASFSDGTGTERVLVAHDSNSPPPKFYVNTSGGDAGAAIDTSGSSDLYDSARHTIVAKWSAASNSSSIAVDGGTETVDASSTPPASASKFAPGNVAAFATVSLRGISIYSVRVEAL
jgi:hypothetical protein